VTTYTFKIYITITWASLLEGITNTKMYVISPGAEEEINKVKFSLQNSLLCTNFTEHKFLFTAVDIKIFCCSILFHNVMKGAVSTSCVHPLTTVLQTEWTSQMLVPGELCQRIGVKCKDSIKWKTAFST
jgi:hypothetical protein